MRRKLMVAVLLGLAGTALLGVASSASALSYGPLNEPGPPLSIPLSYLQGTLNCTSNLSHATVEPVLLNPATGVTAEENYSWNWEPALTALGIPWCAYTAPHKTLDNIEASGEYLVYAIRLMYSVAGRKIAIMGHSQGGMSMRWALRFWPDTRAMVDDVIGFSGSNHGTTVLSTGLCLLGCPAADWQQVAGSNFITALNSRAETFPGISYTEVWTHTDEVVQPNGSAATASASLHGGGGAITDVATQDICPLDPYEHLAIGTIDPVAYALAIDALQHPGPADPGRISRAVCSQAAMPGVNPADLNTYFQLVDAGPSLVSVLLGGTATLTSGAPELTNEPGIACYVTATCTGGQAPTLRMTILGAPPRLLARRTTAVRIEVLTAEGNTEVPVGAVRVSLAGTSARTAADGVAVLRVRARHAGTYALTAARAGCNPARQTVRIGGRLAPVI